jgi:histone H3/H4
MVAKMIVMLAEGHAQPVVRESVKERVGMTVQQIVRYLVVEHATQDVPVIVKTIVQVDVKESAQAVLEDALVHVLQHAEEVAAVMDARGHVQVDVELEAVKITAMVDVISNVETYVQMTVLEDVRTPA